MKNCKAFITGLAGLALNDNERHFIKEHSPWGFILFARNIESAGQLRSLTDEIKTVAHSENVMIFLDQEGGRVQRLRPPLAPNYPAAIELGKIYNKNQKDGLRMAWIMSRLHAFDLYRYGLNADCLPLLDVPIAGSHDVIGARAYGDNPQTVSAMGQAAAHGLIDGGVLPVMKHIPGHGRAMSDTHMALARVDASLDILQKSDFVPFKQLSYLPAAMTAHVIYEAIDKEHTATLSFKVINRIVRDYIGFDGLLMSDDLSMKALSGSLGDLAHQAFLAGCDIALHCNGQLSEMVEVAENSPYLQNDSAQRAAYAKSFVEKIVAADEQALREEFAQFFPDTLLNRVNV